VHARELAAQNYLRLLGDLKAALRDGQNGVRQNWPEQIKPVLDGMNRITPREREVLALIASGKSSKQIAAQFGIAFRSVVAHRYHLGQKLKAHKTVDLTKAALRMGLIEL
jgi:two-component system, NarL family, response regulator FusR